MRLNHDYVRDILLYIENTLDYNPNSYDGYTGIEGLGYRYPVKVYQNKNMRTYRSSITSISPSEVHTMKYVFGSNHLFIGKGIYNILNELEKRYGLDFDKMEEEISQNRTGEPLCSQDK